VARNESDGFENTVPRRCGNCGRTYQHDQYSAPMHQAPCDYCGRRDHPTCQHTTEHD
jgi:hypothetical protein